MESQKKEKVCFQFSIGIVIKTGNHLDKSGNRQMLIRIGNDLKKSPNTLNRMHGKLGLIKQCLNSSIEL